jgi:sugar phosphate isomerase/epimerase
VRLSVITDEISDDVLAALRVAESLGVRAAEIRIFDGRNVVDHPPEDWYRLAADLTAGGFVCPVVDSPFLKVLPVPGDPDWAGVDWAPFDRAIEAAGVLGADTVRVFSGRRATFSSGVLDWLVDVLAETAARAGRAGLRIAVEIEHECTIGTTAEAIALVERASAIDWGFVLDPGNESRLTGRPAQVPAVATLAPHLRHVHVKDVDAAGAWVRVGTGLVGWPDQLGALRDCRYAGYLSMETHYATPPDGLESATRESVQALRILALGAGIETR